SGGVVTLVSTATGKPNATPLVLGSARRPDTGLPARKGKNPPRDDAAGKEATRLKGTWKTVTGEIDGQPLSPLEKQTSWVITGDKITWESVGMKTRIALSFKVDPRKKPAKINLQVGGESLKGIYELDGNTLIVCLGKERPSAFKTSAGSKHTLVV